MNNNRRSCFALITFCATPALLVALGFAVLFTSVALAFAGACGGEPVKATSQGEDNARERLFAGLITDEHCGARHDMESGKSPTECTKMCVRNGSKYVLVEGDKRYALAGNDDDLGALAGQRARVVGVLAGNTIKVSSTGSGP